MPHEGPAAGQDHTPVVDLSEGFARITTGKIYGYSQFQQAFTTMLEHRDYRPGLNALWDLRGGGFASVVADELRRMIEAARRRGSDRAGARVALLVERDLEFGIARMSEMLAGDLDVRLRVFRDPQEAETWVRPAPTPD